MSKTTSKGKGRIAGAHPTAPGGMSERALEDELARDTDLTDADIMMMNWPEKIEAVIQSRLAKGDGKAEVVDDLPDEGEDDDPLDDDPLDDDLLDDDYLLAPTKAEPVAEAEPVVSAEDVDPEALMAEMQEAQAEAEAEKPPSLFIGMPGVKDYIFDGHAGAGPSGAERWMNCTASLEATRVFLETLTVNQQHQFAGANTAARQGTTAHAAAEVEVGLMMGTVSPEEAEHTLMELTVMPDAADEAYDAEMAEFITEYVDLVRQYVDAGHEVLVEQRVEAAVPLTKMLDNGDEVYVVAGSGDFIALPTENERVLTVGDLKYGDGIFVEVDENPQVRIYGLGALGLLADEEGNLPDIERIDYHIIQPRLGGIRTWSESVEDLLAWRDEVLSPALTAALLGQAGGATFNPGEQQCQWCPVRGSCPALTESRVEAAADLFDVIVEAEFTDGTGAFPETTSLSNDRLGSLLAQIEGLVSLKDDLKAEAQRRLHRGQNIPGFKMVSYTPPRKWDEDAATVLDPENGDTDGLTLAQAKALWKHSLITPTQAIKLLGEQADIIEPLVIVPEKRPVIAREGDRRKTWEGRPPEEMFADESGADA